MENMDIAKAKELACEIAGLLTVSHNNLCPDECSDSLIREAGAKAAQLVQLLAYKAEAENIMDEMSANAESEIIEKEEADIKVDSDEEPIEESAEQISYMDSSEELNKEPIEEPAAEDPREEAIDNSHEKNVDESAEMTVDAAEDDITTAPASDDTVTDLNESVFMRAKVDSISKAFTINDKFRFKRELFGNSDPEFSNALDLISVMRSIDEAEDYFYNELCWDVENEDVKDFMRIVRAYFFNRQ